MNLCAGDEIVVDFAGHQLVWMALSTCSFPWDENMSTVGRLNMVLHLYNRGLLIPRPSAPKWWHRIRRFLRGQ